ncbi:MAG TPA: glycosyltransferase family 39 protein [Microvirga sp.]|jgi:4-amino-4-deoxy-L-arabinose transferase-like glycosyltransferase
MTSLAVTERVTLPRTAGTPLSARAIAFVEASHLRLCAVLLLFSLACFLPGLVSLQPMDRDEPRYAQASKQMLETGDFVDIRFQTEARHKKPIGIYWMQSAVVAAAEAAGVPEARTTIALYRLPSLVGALATVLLTYWTALAFLGRRGSFLAAAFMGASILLTVEARLGKTDAVLTACTIAVMGGLARAYLWRRALVALSNRSLAVFWLGMAVGILVKGPLVLLFAGLPALVLSVRERSARWLLPLRPMAGLLFTLAVVLPWFVAIMLKSGGAFFAASVGQDMLGKVGTGQENHWGPPGYYLLAFFGTFWPGAILAAIAVPFAWANRRLDNVAFNLAWIVPTWAIFEAVSTKLPHYVLPLYPAIAILTALAIQKGFVGPQRPLAKVSTLLIPFIPVALTAGLVAAGWHLDGVIPFTALPLLLASSVLSILAWRLFRQGRVVRASIFAIMAAPLLTGGVLGLAQGDLRSLKLSERLAETVRAMPCQNPAVATLGYREPSLVFLVGTGLEMLEAGPEAAAFLKGQSCALVFVERRFDEAFRAEAARLGLSPALSTRVSGFNINGGRRLDLGAYRASP